MLTANELQAVRGQGGSRGLSQVAAPTLATVQASRCSAPLSLHKGRYRTLFSASRRLRASVSTIAGQTKAANIAARRTSPACATCLCDTCRVILVLRFPSPNAKALLEMLSSRTFLTRTD